jgi:hypothetical protein
VNKISTLALSVLFFLCLSFPNLSAQRIRIFFSDSSSVQPTVQKSALRFNKNFAYSLTLDDGHSDAMTHVYPILSGGKLRNSTDTTTNPRLTYTDGCGNDQTFKAGLAWYSLNRSGLDIHTGNVPSLLTWAQLDTLYDSNWDVFNHSLSHRSRFENPMTTADYLNEIEQNKVIVRSRTRKNIEMPLFVVPSGDTIYQRLALQNGQKAVFDQSGAVRGFPVLRVDSSTLSGVPIFLRWDMTFSYNMPVQWLDSVARWSQNAPLNSPQRFWYNEFVHRVDEPSQNGFNTNVFKSRMQRIAQLWGKNGSDKVWMAPLQEVYEYLVMVQKTTLVMAKETPVRQIVSFNLSQVPTTLRRKSITIVVNSARDILRVEVPASVKMTFKGTGSSKIINLDFTNYRGDDISYLPLTVKKYNYVRAVESLGSGQQGSDAETDCIWRIFPNPAEFSAQSLNLECISGVKNIDSELPISVSFTNLFGKVATVEKLSTSDFNSVLKLNIAQLPSGSYSLSLQQDGKNLGAPIRFIKLK